MPEYEKTPMIKLGGLWKNTSKSGKEYFRGSLNGYNDLLIFENNSDKKNEKSPTHILYLSPKTKKEGTGDNTSNPDPLPF